MDPDSKRILVALRIRPQNEAEKFDVTAVRKVDFKSVMVISEELHTSASDSPCIGFSFDAVFDDSDDQRTVYEDGCLGMIDAALDGHFVTILAYGQTGSGKTHTILGAPARPNGDLQDQTGMFLRVFNDLFIYQANMRTRMQVLIALSAVELYVDDIFDLLGDKAKVRLREAGSDAVLSGTKYVEVKSLHEVIAYFSIANAARSVTATKMNATSSRSHALFFIDVFQIPVSSPNQTPLKIDDVITTEGDVKTIKNMVRSRISLVDLAGSERTKKSGVEGQGLVEANAINKSLSTLGNVINALYTRKSHIPFRDHRLTSILRPALLDEKSRVLLVGQVSPASSNSAESIMTLKFCDRLKNLKADSVSLTENPELLQAHANASRQAAEMAADVLLSRERALYSLSRPRFRALRSGASLRDALTNATSRAQAESQAALDKIAKEDAEWLQMKRDAESKKQIALKLEQRMALESLVNPLELEVVSLRAAFDNLTATFTEATDLKMTQAKKAKKTRVQLEEKLKELAQENEKMDTALEYTAARLLALERMKSQPKPQQPETKDADWIAQEEEWAQQEGNHGIVQDFYRLWKPLGEAHADFIKASHAGLAAARSAKEAKGTAAQAKASATTASILGNLVPDVVHYCIDRAVDIATGVIDPSEKFEWFYVYGSSTKLKDWHFWPNPINTTPDPRFPGPSGITASHELTTLSDDDATMDVTGPQRSAATASPVEPPVLEITHAQAVKNAREKRKQNRTAGANNVSKRFESEEANKHYLMTVYDSPTLVQDVSRFLGAGTIMEKHGRSGTPHKKKVFIATTSGQREVVWVDPPEAGAPTGGARSSIPVAGLSKIVLGAYSKVFKRHPSTPNDPPFYLSFTLHTKDKSRTLDLVADTLVDFEAWVLGLSHMVQVDPVWGGTLNIPKEVAVQLQLNPKEVSLCEKENILPNVYAAIRKLITEHRDEVSHQMQIFDNDPVQAYESMGGIHAPQMNHKGAVLMTKGELRYHTKNWNIDIFRVCKLWTLFREMDLIYDPSFLPATCFGTNLRT